MFARNFLNSIRNNSLMITRSQLKNQIPCRFLSSDVVVQHDPAGNVFYVDINKTRAYIKYRLNGDVIKLLSTVVPDELGGKGLGKILVQATFNYVKENNLKMEIYCGFIQHYIDKYAPEYKEFLN